MSTYTDILIRHQNVNDIVAFVDQIYVIGKKITKPNPSEFEFFDEILWPRTLILHQEDNPDWVKIEFDLASLYEFDEILRLITARFQTLAILGYKQTTSGEARFAVFENGKMVRSLVQSSRISDNFGRKFPFEESFHYPKPVHFEISQENILWYYDDIALWYRELGYERGKNTASDIEYLHLEIVDFKN